MVCVLWQLLGAFVVSSCEKCWRDGSGYHSYRDDYEELIKRRNGMTERHCTPEEQAGPDSTECPACKRMTVHQHTHLCQTPGCAAGEYKETP